MKKSLLLVILIILGLRTGLVAQSYKSCMTYDPERTLGEFKDVVLTSKDSFMRDVLWIEYAKLANEILKTSEIEGVKDFVVTADLVGMTWLMDHTVEYESSYFVQENYLNGVRVGNKLEFHNVAGHKSTWAVLKVGDVLGMYTKVACSNPEKPKPGISLSEKQVVTGQRLDKEKAPLLGVQSDGLLTQDLPADVGSSMVKKNPDLGKVPDLNLNSEVKKKNPWPWIIGGTVAATLVGTGIYFLTRGHPSTGGGPVGVEMHKG